jgi:hypothetical protein
MGTRDAIPLNRTRHIALVEGIHNADDADKAMATHLSVGTGPRGDTIGHTHEDWFLYEEGDLYYKIPNKERCRKTSTIGSGPCGECTANDRQHDDFIPKTPAGQGRRIMITNDWTNPVTKEKEYFGLRDRVEDYFALSDNGAPDGCEFGHEMLQSSMGGGVSVGTLNDWIRDIAAKSTISARLRAERLNEELTPDYYYDDDGKKDGVKRTVKEKIADNGKDGNGNRIPDITSHDLRATFCTQLMRNNFNKFKARRWTGHKNIEALEKYVTFADGEGDAGEFKDAY